MIEAKGASTLYCCGGGEYFSNHLFYIGVTVQQSIFTSTLESFYFVIDHDSLFKRNKRGEHHTSLFIGTVYGVDKACI